MKVKTKESEVSFPIWNIEILPSIFIHVLEVDYFEMMKRALIVVGKILTSVLNWAENALLSPVCTKSANKRIFILSFFLVAAVTLFLHNSNNVSILQLLSCTLNCSCDLNGVTKLVQFETLITWCAHTRITIKSTLLDIFPGFLRYIFQLFIITTVRMCDRVRLIISHKIASPLSFIDLRHCSDDFN